MPKSKVRKSKSQNSTSSNRPRVTGYKPYTPPTEPLRIRAVSGPATTSVRPGVKTMGANAAAVARWNATEQATAIALGSDNAFLESLSETARDTLTFCSPDGSMTATYVELLREGVFPEDFQKTAAFRHWLDECYLGTWDNKILATGAFLRDMEGLSTITTEKCQLAYERLTQLVAIHERHLTNGRVVVSMDRAISDLDRFLANQYMLHGSVPEVFTF